MSTVLAKGPLNLYFQLLPIPIIAPVFNQETHLFWSLHYGFAGKIGKMVALMFETNNLVRLTEDAGGEKLAAFAVSPGVRLLLDPFSLELGARFAIGDDGIHPYGRFSVGITLAWTPSAR